MRKRRGRVPLGVVVQAEDELHGDDDEGGGLELVLRQEATEPRVERVTRLVVQTGARHDDADPRVELV